MDNANPLVRTAPVTVRNGLPERVNYVYRGTGQDTLTAGVHFPDQRPDVPGRRADVRPCGTLAAYRRHQRRGEPIDDLCRMVKTAHEQARKRARRGQA